MYASLGLNELRLGNSGASMQETITQTSIDLSLIRNRIVCVSMQKCL